MTPERRSYVRSKCRVQLRVYESSAGWCVSWQTPKMPVRSYWYYPTERKAREVAALLQDKAAK